MDRQDADGRARERPGALGPALRQPGDLGVLDRARHAVSGFHVGKLVRTGGTAGSGRVVLVVRNDASHPDLLLT